jgi:hypothetical protein
VAVTRDNPRGQQRIARVAAGKAASDTVVEFIPDANGKVLIHEVLSQFIEATSSRILTE